MTYKWEIRALQKNRIDGNGLLYLKYNGYELECFYDDIYDMYILMSVHDPKHPKFLYDNESLVKVLQYAEKFIKENEQHG